MSNTDSKKTKGVYEKVPGSKIWWVRHMDCEGRLRREKAGTKSFANDLYTKRRQAALEGIKLPKLRCSPVMFAELADLALTHINGRYACPEDERSRIVLIKKMFAGRADAVTSLEIERVLESLTLEKRWSASTRNHHHNLISLAYRLGIKHGKVTENPARGVQRIPEDNNRVRFLAPVEEERLREAIRENPVWMEHEVELDLALHTGLRRSSMYIGLVWENVDLAGKIAIIPKTKNGEQVVVPLNSDAMRALAVFRSRGDGKGRVVRNAVGETLNVNAHWFPEAVRLAGVKDFRWHDLRHTYASRLRQTGTPLGNIAELLGHKGLTMTRRYAHLSISNLHEAVARIQSLTDTTTDTRRRRSLSRSHKPFRIKVEAKGVR